jgi:hypothetical protein
MLKKFMITAICCAVISNAQAHNQSPTGYYSDLVNNQILAIDPRKMEFKDIVPTIGQAPYPADKAGKEKVYITTRNSFSLDVIYNDSLTLGDVIPLEHRPRSVTYNASGNLAIVSGVKRAMTSVIDVETDEVVAVVGSKELVKPEGFGGSLATGHPFWTDENHFLLLDRANRKLVFYKVYQNDDNQYQTELLYTLKTPTPVHHILSVPKAKGADKNKFYAIAEGAPKEGIAPGLMAFEVSGDHIYHSQTLHLSQPKVDVADMGSHHANFHPDGVHIYLGSTEGYTYVINRNWMQVTSIIETGEGNGHTTFIPEKNLAVTTNHSDTFMTVIDTQTHSKLTNIEVTPYLSVDSKKTQAHTSSYDPKNPHLFYTAASENGRIVEINLDKLEVSRKLLLDGSYPIQGTFIWNTNK